MSALLPKADIAGRRLDVRFVPIADIGVRNHALRWRRYARKAVSGPTHDALSTRARGPIVILGNQV
jgi:hypothetical protein